MGSLADAFRAALPPGVEPPEELELRLATIVSAARAAYGDLALGDDAFVTALARFAGDPDYLERVHAADLYLVIAAASGDERAARELECRIVPEIEVALRRMNVEPVVRDEVTQQLRMALVVDRGLASYAGRGELGGWIRVTATRSALRVLRHTRREVELDDAVIERWSGAASDPATAHLQAHYGRELKAAIAAAIAELEMRQRNLLRQHILDGLTIDELAGVYRVHRATCARWLTDARERLSTLTRRRLTARLGATAAEVDSILRFVDSDIELSLPRLLTPESG